MRSIKSDLFEYEIYDSRIVIFNLLQDKMIIIDGIDYMKYDAKNIIFGSGKIVLILSFIIAIELIILINFCFNDIGLLIFAVLS